MSESEKFTSPIGTRYKAPILSALWSPDSKIQLMRLLWIDLATFQKELGVTCITEAGILEMQDNIDKIDHSEIDKQERILKHDIMAHIHVFGDLCPAAKPFLHLGATSNFINDNVDLILIKKSLIYIGQLLDGLFAKLMDKSLQYAATPTIAYTHLQPAQLTTVGKRFALWNSDIKMDIMQLNDIVDKLIFRGVKGTVGSEDSILKIFNGDGDKCDELNRKFREKYGFKELIICGQTYSRKYDVNVFRVLSDICQTIYKMMNDIRLLSSKNEIFEHFSEKQVGSSAMPYKTNPINCEKICSLCRYVVNQEICMKQTYMNQWLERTLDDSAIKRIIYPECFLLVEYVVTETDKIMEHLVIHFDKINRDVVAHMPFILSEELIIEGVKQGYNRQDIHERLRVILVRYKFSLDTNNNNTINTNKSNVNEDILTIFKEDEILSQIISNIVKPMEINPQNYIGRCETQVSLFSSF
jgi:adenylosuccinate lyase